ncbi:uncharacterized protein [Dysidea avara]|uniref:uncharacterized protein n=1 Tax=Dysidea avara TaxID=196820 RepID=UPI003318BCF3
MKWIVLFTITQLWINVVALVIHVVPDHPNIINCPSQPCTTLDNLLLNNSLSNISNVEFKLLPGVYNVTSNLVIQHVHNVSFVGVEYASMDVILKCFYRTSFQVVYSYNATISNLVFEQCGGYRNWLLSICPIDGFVDDVLFHWSESYSPSLHIACCSFTSINNVTIQDHMQYAIIGYNMVRISYLNSITIYTRNETSWGIMLCLDDNEYTFDYDDENNTIFVTNLLIGISSLGYAFANMAVDIKMAQDQYNMNLIIRNSVFVKHFTSEPMIRISTHSDEGCDNIFLTNCAFSHNKQYGINPNSLVKVTIISSEMAVTLLDCTFNMNEYSGPLVSIYSMLGGNVSLINVSFNYNIYCGLIFFRCYDFGIDIPNCNLQAFLTEIFINKTQSLFINNDLILAENVLLHLSGNILIFNNKARSIITSRSSTVTFSNNVMFFNNTCVNIIDLQSNYIRVLEYTTIVFESNYCYGELLIVETDDTLYPYCLFQYLAPKSKLAVLQFQYQLQLYSIKFIGNSRNFSGLNYYTSHCRWLETAVFNGYDPGLVNSHIIHSNSLVPNHHTNLCYCPQNGTYNCTTDTLGHIYPGETLQADLCLPLNEETEFSEYSQSEYFLMYIETQNIVIQNVTCKIAHEAELTVKIGRKTTVTNFTIVSKRTDQCFVFLTAQPYLYKYYDVFHVKLLPCPIGFTLLNGICDCDPYLVNSDLQINTCYINEVAIQRPANSWIGYNNHSTETHYSISSHCPMDYCSPSTTKLNLEHPDSQCQFHRTSLLCSQCQNELSMIFGSSRCMKCTNVYLLLSIAVLIAGVVLVVLLYCLNLTVTKGTINGIIFYANIISINGSVFLVNDNVYKPLKVFISFTNLDLGIETCFYNGMDSYAKMWLQLFFPFYLIMMATLLIITSRYSTRIQRLIFTRSLPVLTTLFLLSYTGILRNVSTVLFSYSTITELPSNHQHLVWSIDASVPLFGVKFTILFITCLISFVVLIPFNMTLLFTRYVMRFRIINRFKPLLDAFQGSYKHKHYYWIAVYIIIRNVFFALHMFTAEVRLIVGAIILIITTTFYGYICPHKSILVNIQEYLLLINVTIIYSASYHCSDTISSTITNVMITIALIHFTIILLYHFLTFTCHCNVENKLWDAKEKIIKCCHLTHYTPHREDMMSFEIPELTCNYAEYRDGLVSDDFKQ